MIFNHFLFILLFSVSTFSLVIDGFGQIAELKKLPENTLVSKIAFGSCNFQFRPQPIWKSIMKENPQLWIWLGDNIYADTHDTLVMRKKYAQQLANPDYKEFMKTVPIIGVWDDHDMGMNDADAHYPEKEPSRQMFCDFMGEAPNSERRKRSGVYESYTFENEGKSVKIILLDTRFNKSKKIPVPDILGEEQWKWFEDELLNSKAQVNIIATSIQFLSRKKISENWHEFPYSVKRIYDLLARHGKPNVLFISGDIHCGEISVSNPKESPFVFYEATSSGLTHTNFFDLEDSYYDTQSPFVGFNFGTIQIAWSNPPVVEVIIHNKKGRPVLRQTIPMKN
jgi:alkaline phosphatase D